jgi:hypothetical protein
LGIEVDNRDNLARAEGGDGKAEGDGRFPRAAFLA